MRLTIIRLLGIEMVKIPAFQFYPADWLNDIKLQSCSLGAQGLLINLMCIMHQSEPYGKLMINNHKPSMKDVSHLLRLHHKTYQARLKELLLYGVLYEDENGIVCNKRMMKDEYIRQIRRESGKLGGNPLLKQKVKQVSKQKSTPSSSTSSSPSKIKDNSAKKLFYLTYKKRKLSGKRLETFEIFWNAFDYKKGRAAAADSWLDIPELTDVLVTKIVFAAGQAAIDRPGIINNSGTPPMAQGWITGKRWEDEVSTRSEPEEKKPKTHDQEMAELDRDK